MGILSDPALFKSGFKRHLNDAYYTEPAVSKALARRLPSAVKAVWEPACGRGDMAQMLLAHGKRVFCSDLDISDIDVKAAAKVGVPVRRGNFLDDKDIPEFVTMEDIDAICTNPPFGDDAERFVRQALTFSNIRFFAFVLRSEWKHGKSRLDLFTKEPYSSEIVLTWRPRWDWWMTEDEKRAARIANGKDPDKDYSPRHNFSILCWDREHKGPPTQQFAVRGD